MVMLSFLHGSGECLNISPAFLRILDIGTCLRGVKKKLSGTTAASVTITVMAWSSNIRIFFSIDG